MSVFSIAFVALRLTGGVLVTKFAEASNSPPFILLGVSGLVSYLSVALIISELFVVFLCRQKLKDSTLKRGASWVLNVARYILTVTAVFTVRSHRCIAQAHASPVLSLCTETRVPLERLCWRCCARSLAA